jgi:hypothetical protein
MKKIIIILLVLSFLFGKQVYGVNCVCCRYSSPVQGYIYGWAKEQCFSGGVPVATSSCQDKAPPPDCTTFSSFPEPPPLTIPIPKEEIKPGEVRVEWKPKLISVCPPGILRIGGPCEKYPTLEYLIATTTSLILKISPPLLTLLIIFGGLMYLLTPFNVEEYIKKGHNYIKYAVFGYILLLLVTLIFTIISAFLGGPSP